MTMTQRRRYEVGRSTANPAQGVRVERPKGNVVRLTPAGRIAVPLVVYNNGSLLDVSNLVLTYDEAAALHVELGQGLAEAESVAPEHSRPSEGDRGQP